MKQTTENVRPFIKWAGGKSQLIPIISEYYPFSDKITKYVEPFVGGGAVLLDIVSKYNLDEIYANDANKKLINTYLAVQNHVDELIALLQKLQNEFIPASVEERRRIYERNRLSFNKLPIEGGNVNVESAALFIFLNKTCFNGLYRVNKSGQYNVSMGTYKEPVICDCDNLVNVSKRLSKVTFLAGDYADTEGYIDENTFVYIDPPYRPLTKTAAFTSYTSGCFSDDQQIKLADYVRRITERGAKILMSNSDPKNIDPDDDFFEKLYDGFEINRIKAGRSISCKGDTRGTVNELLITNIR